MSDIEKLTAYHSIKSYLSKEDQKELIKKLGLGSTDLGRRLQGLTNEDEFCLILYYLECCKHMISFNEGASFLTESYSPDMLIELVNGEKLFIEIKSKHEEDHFKISGGNLQKRIDFANDFNFPLYFAVKLKGYWGLFPSSYLQNNSGKIVFPIDFNNSVFNQKFNGKFYIFPKGLKIESEYSQTDIPIGSIRHPDYGNLISYKFSYKEKLIFEANQEDESKIRLSLLLEHLEDVMSIQSQKVETLDNGNILIVEELKQLFASTDYAFFLSPITHTINNFEIKYDSNSFFKSILEDRSDRLIRGMLKELISAIKEFNVPVIETDNITLKEDGSFEAEV